MINELDQFHAIAWDFDKTLVDSPKSPLIHKYIKEHPDKTHVIVTHRSHGMQFDIFPEMRHKFPDAPDQSDFDGVYNISNRAWERFDHTQRLRKIGRFKGPPTPWELYYVNWKGLVCKLRGLQVLVDDKPQDSLPGCEKYGIAFIDTMTL